MPRRKTARKLRGIIMITVLAGGIGAAKFLEGLAAVIAAGETTVIVNTGDDTEIHGLHVSPDMDTVMYTLAGVVNRETGWGIAGDTYRACEALKRLGAETWFQLGDQDLATHIFRTRKLNEGVPLSEVTGGLCKRFGVECRLLPMSDEPAPTRLRTSAGWLSFQDYFVKLRQEPEVLEVDLSTAGSSKPASGVLDAIANSQGVIVAPSNPLISIGPILAVPGIREALRMTAAPVAAISPIVGGKALKGPADRMMQSLGFGSSATSVADLYRDFVDVFILDEQDAALQAEVVGRGLRAVVAPTVMNSSDAKRNLARTMIGIFEQVHYSGGGAGRAR